MKIIQRSVARFRFLIGLFVLVVLLQNCEVDEPSNDQVENSIQEESPITIQEESPYVNIDEVPEELTSTLESFESERTSAKNGIGFLKVDRKRIVKMVDDSGNISFSLNFVLPKTPRNVIYNLVLRISRKRRQQEPFVLQYTIDNLEDIRASDGQMDFMDFKGTVHQYSLRDFLNTHTSKTGKRDCEPYRFNGSGGNPAPTDTPANTSTSGGGGCWGYIFSSGGKVYSITILGCHGNAQKSAKDDCPNRTGGSAGINPGGGNNSSVHCPNGRVIGNECVEYDEEFKTPCKQMDEAESDSPLKAKLSELKGKTNDNREFGRLITGTYPTKFSGFLVGRPNEAGISFVASSKIDGFLHSHYKGLLPVFSGSDIKAIYDLHKESKIRKWKTFSAYLVTSGTTYALKIDDINDFLAFGDRFLSSENKFNGFESLINLNIKLTNTNVQNELAFANLIKGSGLKLFKGNPVNFGTWTPITSNKAKTGIINDNCN